MKIINFLLTLSVVFLYYTCLNSQEFYNANVTYQLNEIENDTINKNIFGGFTEFLNDYINGSMGLWAQELNDRGFDYILESSSSTSSSWEYWNKDKVNDSISLESVEKYNENGLFSQRIKNISSNGETGIRQKILISDTTTHTFYIYAMSSGLNLNVSFYDLNDNILFSKKVKTDDQWQKYEFSIPMINKNSVYIYYSINETGTIYLDESSLVPDNNVSGIRAEYAKIFRDLKIGALRYPGGTFVSTHGGHWSNGTRHIDKRVSPIKYGPMKINQRMDFGYLEYLKFCDEFNLDPYIVSSYTKHTLDDHSNVLEYLMGDPTSEYGAMRKDDGQSKPFDITYYEIGNEEWENGEKYAKYYRDVYKSIKKNYNNLEIIVAGNHWLGKGYIKNQMQIFNNDLDIYGWHPAKTDLVNDDLEDSLNFLSIVGIPEYTAGDEIRNYYEFCRKYTNNSDFKVGITEWWSHYGDFTNWTLDTHWRNNSLESGLWDAGMLLGFMKNSKYMDLANRTMGMSWINRKINPVTGKKAIFPSVGLKAAIFINSHRGKLPIPVKINSPVFNIHEDSLAYHFETKYLDASCTYDKDSIYFYFINRSPNKPIKVSHDIFEKISSNLEAKKYTLTSSHFLDYLTAEEPDRISFSEEDVLLEKEIEISPFSFITYAVSNDILSSINNNVQTGINNQSIIVKEFITLEDNYKSIEIYDLYGKKIHKAHLNYGQKQFNVSSLKKGFYTLILINNNKLTNLNILKI